MPWVYLDDAFPEHPKTMDAGGDAAWLFVCALAYCNRRLTGGRVPKSAVPQLTDRKQPMKLAQRLVEVGYFEDVGDAFLIHQYDEWQRASLEAAQRRVEKARNAAKKRWGTDAQSNAQARAQADAQAPPQAVLEQCSTDASRGRTRAHGTQPPTTPSSYIPPPLTSVGASDGGGEDPIGLQAIAVTVLARRRYTAAEQAGTHIRHPDRFLATKLDEARRDVVMRGPSLLAQYPDLTADELAAVIAGDALPIRHRLTAVRESPFEELPDGTVRRKPA